MKNEIQILDEALEVATAKGSFGRRQAAQIDQAFNVLVHHLKKYEELQESLTKEKPDENRVEPILKPEKEVKPKTPQHKGN